ncbi:unnamed protein product [Knipowitschia caucasica]
MGKAGEDKPSCRSLLTFHREALVSKLRSIQCVLDNLLSAELLCEEEVEAVQRTDTKPNQVRKLLELVQCKGEPACEYFIYILYSVGDAFIHLQPWLKEICYVPSAEVSALPVDNTDPISRYSDKQRREISRDTSFIMSYGQREETRLEHLYTDTLMELFNEANESLGFLDTLDRLLTDDAVFNPQGETIYVVGDAGVGKSILLQKLQNLWSKKQLVTDTIFLFKFRCRMFSTFKDSEQISLRDLLFKYNCCPDLDPDNEVFDYITNFPHKVLFTFDGYDEIQDDLERYNIPEVFSPDEKAHPFQLLTSLLSGKLLQGSQKVLTARTGIELQHKVVKKKIILRGFSPSHLNSYIHLHFKDQDQRERVQIQLDASPHLCGLCSTPLFCWIVFKSFTHLHIMHDSFELPESRITLTDIFLLLCEMFLTRSAPLPSSIQKKKVRCTSETFKSGFKPLAGFAKLALRGFHEGSFYFSREDLRSCGLTEEDEALGFLRSVNEYETAENPATFEFLHLTLQSFLAALWLVLDEEAPLNFILTFFAECSRKKRSSCLPCDFFHNLSATSRGTSSRQKNDHLQFTNLFLCGLLSKPKTRLMEQLVAPTTLKKKQALLKSYLSTSVKSHLHGLPVHKNDEGKKVHVLPNFLWMLRCIYETGNKGIAKMTAKGITAGFIKLGYCNVYSGDCTALNFVLQHRRKLLGLDMDNNNVSDYGIKQLRPSLSKMTIVRFCVNNLSDSSMEVLAEELCKSKVVEVLGLYNNFITDAGAKLVAKIIEECPKLRTVKIGKNKITPVGGRYLANAIQKSTSIFDVGMWGNTLGDEGAFAFAEALRHHPSLSNLSLSANGITSEGGKHLSSALKDNNSLRIFWLVQNDLSDDCASHFAELVRTNTGLTHLWLINNKFTVEGIRRLAEALPENNHLKEICLKGNLLSPAEEEEFVEEKRLRFH